MQQIADNVALIARYTPIRVVTLVGGMLLGGGGAVPFHLLTQNHN